MTQPNQPPEEVRPNFRTPENYDFPTGPAIGDMLPDFTLPDQNGRPVTFSEARGGNRALVMFHRSARW